MDRDGSSAFDRQMFGSRLRDSFKGAERSHVEVAAHLRVSPNRVSEWVTGKGVPSVDQLAALVPLLDVDLHWLITDCERPAAGARALIRDLARVAPTLKALAERGQALAAADSAAG